MSDIMLYGPDYEYPILGIDMYSDNTPLVKTPGLNVKAVSSLFYRHSSVVDFFTAMSLVTSVMYRGGNIETLVIPYLPGARQDRINPEGDVLWSCLQFAEYINLQDFGRVVAVDPHSGRMPSYIRNFVEYPLFEIAQRIPKKYNGVIAPDKGAVDRATKFATQIGVPVYQASKERDVTDGSLKGFDVDVPPGHYLVVDDICDGGGTFIGLGEKIDEQMATADLYVTHGIFSKGTRQLRKLYHTIYTTDTLVQSPANEVTVLPVVERMMQL